MRSEIALSKFEGIKTHFDFLPSSMGAGVLGGDKWLKIAAFLLLKIITAHKQAVDIIMMLT